MNTDIEELLRDGMERFTADVRAPIGLAREAGRRHRRRARTAVACGTAAAAAVTAAAVALAVGAGAAARPAGSLAQAHTVAYVTQRVENALATENLIFAGRTNSKTWGTAVTWAYGPRNRQDEFTSTSCGHVLPNGDCTNRGGPELYTSQGTALVGGKLVGADVAYDTRTFSLYGPAKPVLASACSATGALTMGGPPVATSHWSAFISTTLACGAASVTGHVRVDGMETTRITGKPITVRLQPGYAKTVRAKLATVRWTLYVNPATYLPVRIYGSTQTYGGSAGSFVSSAVTDVQWLPPTRANTAKALVTIPAGFRQVSTSG